MESKLLQVTTNLVIFHLNFLFPPVRFFSYLLQDVVIREVSKVIELTYPPAGAGCRALSTSKPCPGYCMARVGAKAKNSKNHTIVVSALGRSRVAQTFFLIATDAVIKEGRRMPNHSSQQRSSTCTRNYVTQQSHPMDKSEHPQFSHSRIKLTIRSV